MSDDAQTLNAANAGTIQIGTFQVNRMGYGAMRLTGEGVWGPPAVPAEAKAVLERAVELGVNFIDTADAYGPEVSENIIAEVLKPYDGLLIATKGGMTRQGPGQWTPNGSPEHLRNACEASWNRLGAGRPIDVYQLHAPDPSVPFEISLQTLIDLQHEDKIMHIGLSNVSAEQLEKACDMAEIVSVQNNYNLVNREHEAVLKLCEERGIAFIPYFPIGGDFGPAKDLNKSGGPLQQFADKHQATPSQIALAWLLHYSEIMLPIPGTGSIKHLEENIGAASVKLDEADMRELDALQA